MNHSENPRIVGRVPFVDGVERDVFEEGDGRQWVTGQDGERVYGTWLAPSDEPVLVVAALGRPRKK